VVYCPSFSLPAAMAVPKYRPLSWAAAASVLSAAFAGAATISAVPTRPSAPTAATTPRRAPMRSDTDADKAFKPMPDSMEVTDTGTCGDPGGRRTPKAHTTMASRPAVLPDHHIGQDRPPRGSVWERVRNMSTSQRNFRSAVMRCRDAPDKGFPASFRRLIAVKLSDFST